MKRAKYTLREGEKHPLLGQEKIKNLDVDIRNIRTRSREHLQKICLIFIGCAVIISAVLFGYLMGANSYAEKGYEDSRGFIESDEGTESINDTQASVNVPNAEQSTEKSDEQSTETVMTPEELYYFDPSTIPDGELAVIPMDLSMYENGVGYINNLTGYTPDTDALLSANLKKDGYEALSSNTGYAPRVLILHTHATEAYLEDGAKSYVDDGFDIARSEDAHKNMISLGKVMSEILVQNGIPTVHCTVMHDSVQYLGAYERAKATIEEYLEKYPSIELVIDLERDSLMRASGELIRPVTLVNSKAVAQVACVVGSDWGGESCPNWRGNLSIALKLREMLNAEYVNLCRPCELGDNTYNQELAPYSMLIEIGSCGNSMEEAKRTVALVAEKLIEIIKGI